MMVVTWALDCGSLISCLESEQTEDRLASVSVKSYALVCGATENVWLVHKKDDRSVQLICEKVGPYCVLKTAATAHKDLSVLQYIT